MSNSFKITEDLFWVGALDPNLKIFDIIMETKFGTSYNSYLLQGSDGIALFETVKEKFFDEHLDKIRSIVNLEDINYIVVNHTEPDHAGSVKKILEYAPNATVVGSNLAIKYLSEIINKPFKSKVVKDGETLSLGNKTLKFISVPQLHWPDTMYTYVIEDETLVTCDSFGAHYCDDRILKSAIEDSKEDDYVEAYNYYFRMIMGPFKPFMLKAIDKIKDLNLKYICPGHGLVLDHTNIDKFINLYIEWCQPTKREKQSIVIPYVTAYGYTEEIANEIKRGIEASNFDVDILVYNLVTADMDEVLNEINQCSGLLLGSPTLLSDTLPQIWTILSSLNPVIHKGLPASCFGSYGWSGEALKNINERYKQLRLNVVSEPLGIIFRASEENLKAAYDFGLEFANKVLK